MEIGHKSDSMGFNMVDILAFNALYPNFLFHRTFSDGANKQIFKEFY